MARCSENLELKDMTGLYEKVDKEPVQASRRDKVLPHRGRVIRILFITKDADKPVQEERHRRQQCNQEEEIPFAAEEGIEVKYETERGNEKEYHCEIKCPPDAK